MAQLPEAFTTYLDPPELDVQNQQVPNHRQDYEGLRNRQGKDRAASVPNHSLVDQSLSGSGPMVIGCPAIPSRPKSGLAQHHHSSAQPGLATRHHLYRF